MLASSTGSVSNHTVPATTIDHENMGTRSSQRPGVRSAMTVVRMQTEATTSEASTSANPA